MINRYDAVAFLGKLLDEQTPDLTGADYYNIHIVFKPLLL
jgi:hypothetical protein